MRGPVAGVWSWHGLGAVLLQCALAQLAAAQVPPPQLNLHRLPPVGASAPVVVGEPGVIWEGGGFDPSLVLEREAWTWQLLPDGLIYRSYLAGVREPRIGVVWSDERGNGALWDSTLGGRVGILRHGTQHPAHPEGWQLDIEGAAFPRLLTSVDRDLASVDFRFGVPLTYGAGPWSMKMAFYHLSSHLGDEFWEKNPDMSRVNYVRDALVWGVAYRPNDDWRLYAEAGWAFHMAGGAEPWEFQFGAEFSPARANGFHGAPFLAVNAHLQEEVYFGGNLTAQAGWQWRGADSGSLLRAGVQYFTGQSNQYQFFQRDSEQQIGAGLWYDF
ncbi:MAG: DUF1207 domain-containing protein [Planctomycetes bacterium]|nr:DUF1207 domain-containing protein [Planctomycetota bacterium]